MLLRTPGTRSTSRGRTGLSDARRCPASASASVTGGRTATQLARPRGRHSLTVAVPGPRRSPVSRNPSPLQGAWVAPVTPAGAWREQVPSLQGHSAETSSRDGLRGPVGKRGKGQGGRGVLRAVSVWAGQDQWRRLTSPSPPSEPETKPLHVHGRDPARETGLPFTGGKLSPRDTKHLPGSGSKGQGRGLNQASWPLSRPQGDHGMCHPAPGQGPHPSVSGRACPAGVTAEARLLCDPLSRLCLGAHLPGPRPPPRTSATSTPVTGLGCGQQLAGSGPAARGLPERRCPCASHL